jgi:hypothetical protein
MATHVNYCHNCGYHSELSDGTYCGYCLTRFHELGRLPRASDYRPAPTALDTLYTRMGWATA